MKGGCNIPIFRLIPNFLMQSTRITKEAEIAHSGGSLQTVAQIFSQKIVKVKNNVGSICHMCPGLAVSHIYIYIFPILALNDEAEKTSYFSATI